MSGRHAQRPGRGAPRCRTTPFHNPRRSTQKGKGKAPAAIDGNDDVYEYAPSKVRRANVSLSLDRHEIEGRRRYGEEEPDAMMDADLDLAGLSHEAMQKLRSRLMREDEDDDVGGGSGQINRDDDEDIESDEGDENENDDEEEEEEEDEEEEEEEEESEVEDDDDDDDSSPQALADLETFLSTLDPAACTKRKPEENVTESGPKKRPRVTVDRTEAGEESEFGARGSNTLKLDDLLAPLTTSSLAELKKSTKPLSSASTKTKTLSAPLPQRAQERLDREAAYEKTKEEIDKWSATMKHIKEAEHLSFPLQAEKPGRVSNLELAARFQPSNELESSVDKLLKSAQLRDEDIAQTESLKMAHLTVEEVDARRTELKVMRELAFRADKKAKRIAKIKSKTYRRIRRKQRERLDGDADADEEDKEVRLKAEVQRARERATLRHKNTGKWARWAKGREGLDVDQRQAIVEMLERGEKLRRRIRGEQSGDEGSGDSGSDAEDEEEQAEDKIRRDAFDELAKLRAEGDVEDDGAMDLKSKSVFNMKFMREAAARQAREADAQAEQLQKEMMQLEEGEGEDESEDEGTVTTAAAAAAKDDHTTTTMVERTGGRFSFRPGTVRALPGSLKPLGSLASDTSSVTLQSVDLLIHELSASEQTPVPSVSFATPTPTPTLPPSISNPWLVAAAAAATATSSSTSGLVRKRNEVRVHKDADVLAKSSNKLRKQGEKREEERERARDDAVLEIDADNVLTIPEPEPALPAQQPAAPHFSSEEKEEDKNKYKNKNKRKRKAKTDKKDAPKTTTTSYNKDTADHDDDSEVASEVEEQERAAAGKKSGKGGIQAFQQRELVALAFAGDNVVQAFEEAKRQETEADAPRKVDTTLPGWGSWGGTGTQKRPPKARLIKSLPGVAPASRADHAKPHLIVSEKRDKKAARYLVRELPYPYTSHAQYERRMDVPIGSEWNTRVGFQRGTMPKVVKKMGTVIDPLERLF